jgi:hypothetical protein
MISVTRLMQFRKIRILIYFTIIFILLVNVKSGNRSDILYILLAYFVAAFHERAMINIRWLFKNFPIILIVFAGLQLIYVVREIGSDLSLVRVYEVFSEMAFQIDFESLKNKIYRQDYFAPSATLVMVVDSRMIDPIGWILSNFFNIIPGYYYPTVSDLILKNQGMEFERGAGFSYMIYVDGYVLAGIWGSIFIGMVSGLMPGLFSILSNSTKGDVRLLILVSFGFLVLQFLRNGLGINFRIFVMLFIPSIIYVYIWLTNVSTRHLD